METLEVADLRLCQPYLERTGSVTWIHVQGAAGAETLHGFGDILGLHALALEDISNPGQRPKLDEYDDHVFVVLNLPVLDEAMKFTVEQVSFFVSANYMVTFHAGADPFTPVRERLTIPRSRIRSHGVGYLFYTLLDVLVDRGFPVLERFDEAIEATEEKVLGGDTGVILPELHRIRRGLLVFRKSLWPQREVISRLLDGDCTCIPEEIHTYLRDCYDHAAQIIDVVESYREVIAGILEIHVANVSNRLNETMRVLTLIATVFIPLTFVVGVYGMSFGADSTSPWAMPELRWEYGYPMVWALMLGMVGGMLYFFRRKGWF